MKKIYVLLVLSLMMIALFGCSEEAIDSQESPNSEFVEYGVAGEIVEINDDATTDTIKILVKGDENNGATYTQGWVTINEDTKIYKSDLIEKDELELNMYVNVFFDGPVAESFPVQGTAKQINIINPQENNDNDTEE